MPIQSTNPIVKEGITYPYFMINLAISPLVQSNDIGGSVAMRLTPYRVLEDGSSESLPDDSLPFVYMDIFNSGDAPALQSTVSILGAIQQFIIDKGI